MHWLTLVWDFKRFKWTYLPHELSLKKKPPLKASVWPGEISDSMPATFCRNSGIYEGTLWWLMSILSGSSELWYCAHAFDLHANNFWVQIQNKSNIQGNQIPQKHLIQRMVLPHPLLGDNPKHCSGSHLLWDLKMTFLQNIMKIKRLLHDRIYLQLTHEKPVGYKSVLWNSWIPEDTSVPARDPCGPIPGLITMVSPTLSWKENNFRTTSS